VFAGIEEMGERLDFARLEKVVCREAGDINLLFLGDSSAAATGK